MSITWADVDSTDQPTREDDIKEIAQDLRARQLFSEHEVTTVLCAIRRYRSERLKTYILHRAKFRASAKLITGQPYNISTTVDRIDKFKPNY